LLQEICSGAQRCHDATKLRENLAKKGVDPAPLAAYVNSFEHGVGSGF
jgi:aspartyl-tRNA synthetase